MLTYTSPRGRIILSGEILLDNATATATAHTITMPPRMTGTPGKRRNPEEYKTFNSKPKEVGT